MTSPLGHGQSAELRLADGDAWAARVVKAADELVSVSLDGEPVADPRALTGTALQLSVATPRGIVSAPATVLGVDAIGLVELQLLSPAEVDQRREHVRVEGRLPGVVERVGAGQRPLHTYTLDVSGGGLLVAGIGPADDGDTVVVTVKLPGREPLRVEGRVARRTPEGHAGLVLDGISDADREELVRWIFERQRLERAAARKRT